MTKPTMKSTKEVIFNAYEQAIDQIKELKSNSYDPKAEKKAVEREVKAEAGTTAATESKTFRDSTDDITAAIQKHVSEIVEAYEESSAKLQSIEEAIVLKKQDLKDLYEIEANIDSLAALINAHDSTVKNQRESHTSLLAEYKAELTEVLENIKQAKANHEAALKEFDEELKKTNKRKEEEYDYEFERMKIVRMNDMNDEIESLMVDVNAEREELSIREEKVAAREAEIDKLEEVIASIPSKINADVAKATNALKASLTAQHELEIAKLNAEFESKIAILSHKSEILETSLEAEREAHKNTSAKLETAYERMEKVATASVEGARTEETVNRLLSTMNEGKK